MSTDISVFLTYAGAVLLIFIFGRLFLWPLKVIFKLIINSLMGGVVILLVNFIGEGFNLVIPLNLLNSVIVGVLGLPGAILILLKNFLI